MCDCKTEDKQRFSEDDKRRMENLPAPEQMAYYRRLSEITMRLRIADDRWHEERDQIDTDLDVLVKELKARLETI